jgi:hypothetical protein
LLSQQPDQTCGKKKRVKVLGAIAKGLQALSETAPKVTAAQDTGYKKGP